MECTSDGQTDNASSRHILGAHDRHLRSASTRPSNPPIFPSPITDLASFILLCFVVVYPVNTKFPIAHHETCFSYCRPPLGHELFGSCLRIRQYSLSSLCHGHLDPYANVVCFLHYDGKYSSRHYQKEWKCHHGTLWIRQEFHYPYH